MEIMKSFTRKSSKFLIKSAFGSILLIVSALAVFTPSANATSQKEKENKDFIPDSLFTARKVFEKIHCSALEILPPTIRLDLLDYWDVDSIYKASNVMDGLSWLENVSPNYLKVRITSVSSLEIKILPDKKEKIAMTIYTVGDDVQAQDSQVKFYDQTLKELPSGKYLNIPEVKDFFEIPKGSATKMKEIEDMIPFPTIAFSASPDNDDIEARLTVEQYINQDDWNIAKLFVKPYITLEWHKDKYRLKKSN